MVRVHSIRPCVSSFIRASTKELANSPAQKAMIEAMKMRGAGSNTAASVAWPSQPGAGGMCTTTHDMAAAKAEATKPTQTTRRARA